MEVVFRRRLVGPAVAAALPASAATHLFPRCVAKPWTEEPDAGNLHVRIHGSLEGAIPRGDPTGCAWYAEVDLLDRIGQWKGIPPQQIDVVEYQGRETG